MILAARCAWDGLTRCVAQVLACIVTTVNRVDGVYERELDTKMILVANETMVIFPSATGDPFTGNANSNTLIAESQSVIDSKIGTINYDAGHTFSTGGGGLSTLGGVCDASNKAQSITGSQKPVGDPYDIDYVAHEMGHNHSGDHTFASTSASCAGNGASGYRVEPGSGISIMAYAGICAPDNDSTHSIPYFHTISFDEMSTFIASARCLVQTPTTNHTPIVSVDAAAYSIPKSTPFKLTGSGTDADV